MIGIPIALLAANGVEWYLHKYALHGVPKEGGGRKALSEPFMKRHWAHHRRVRLTNIVMMNCMVTLAKAPMPLLKQKHY